MEHTQTMVADAKQQAQALRKAGLELLAEMYAAEHDLNKEMVLQQLLWHEQMTLIFRKLGYHVSGKTYAPLKKLLSPDNPTNLDNTMWTGILEAEAIWEALLEQGWMHFSQAKDTSFALGPIANKIGPFKFNEYSKQIVKGTFKIESLTNSVEVIDIVEAMSYVIWKMFCLWFRIIIIQSQI